MEWTRKNAKTFELTDNGQVLGKLHHEPKVTTWEAAGKFYHFKLKNSWKQQYQLIGLGPDGKILGDMRPKNWYGSSSIISLEGAQYHLTFTNNPLAAVQLLDEKKQLLVQARLVTVEGRVQTEFSMDEAFKSTPYAFWLAGIVWHYFYPIAQSEGGDIDAGTFILLATA
ncbi:hypothetical protein [Runella salmonicolor]|uniref:Uncharacterized protein n=1 Tax=Runella salmonicolor TaxID=2950278 RepID=A0ABT1FSM3_9BACT|nr:hypothetical protein [Runella salmonicolor]MCP1384765.1 hypothetical protein [Runella salmonicolor]